MNKNLTEEANAFLASIETRITIGKILKNNQIVLWENLKKLRTQVSKKEYDILRLRVRDRWPLDAVGEKLNMTRERVRKYEHSALLKISNISSKQFEFLNGMFP